MKITSRMLRYQTFSYQLAHPRGEGYHSVEGGTSVAFRLGEEICLVGR